MKILVFGASGKTGKHVVQQALEAGHSVTAFVRDPAKLTSSHPNLSVFRGDVLEAAQVEQAMSGMDAVISALGPGKNSPPDLLERATRNIVTAMQKHGVKRIVAEGGAGARVPQDSSDFGGRAIGWLIANVFIPGQVKDKHKQLELLKTSGLEFVVVRAPVLTDGPKKGGYTVGYPPMGPGAQISRADIAGAMLEQLTDSKFLGQAPAIRY